MSSVQSLLNLLDVERLDDNLFRGQNEPRSQNRLFGGQVIAQSLVAAYKTLSGGATSRYCHSLHAYFLRPGDPAVPVIYQCERTRDGRSFTTRRVLAIQHGRPIFQFEASFQIEEEGWSHQLEMPEVGGPLSVPDEQELRIQMVEHENNKKILERSGVAVESFLDLRAIEQRLLEPMDLIRSWKA